MQVPKPLACGGLDDLVYRTAQACRKWGDDFVDTTFADDPTALVGIPWRYARHVIDYLALNFFDGVLNANAEALARLDPAVLGTIDDLTYESK